MKLIKYFLALSCEEVVAFEVWRYKLVIFLVWIGIVGSCVRALKTSPNCLFPQKHVMCNWYFTCSHSICIFSKLRTLRLYSIYNCTTNTRITFRYLIHVIMAIVYPVSMGKLKWSPLVFTLMIFNIFLFLKLYIFIF